ncbi:ProQ/FINO family protein [Salinicola endophyticus]|nr:ProQ/FINO family protein [Salinicola endophyticus]
MLTERTQALLAEIERKIDASQAALEAERERSRTLASENRALKERLLALAELDPMISGGHVHPEDPDGGSRVRGLGSLAFRRSRAREEGGEEASRRSPSPLQRLTSTPSVSPELPAEQGGPAAPEMAAAPQAPASHATPPSEPAAASASPSSPTPPPQASDDAAAVSDGAGGAEPADGGAAQNTLAFGAEHEAPSPHALLAQWYKRYPQAFFKGHTRPLKTGIHLDLCACEPWPEKLVRRALACYVHLPRYLKSVREGARRVDLQGADSDVVSAEEAKHAKRQLEALQKKQQVKETRQRADKLDRKIGELLAKHGRRDA